MESNLDEISCLITKFFHLFIVESRFLEAFEFDNFIVRNVKMIAAWYVGKVSTIAGRCSTFSPSVWAAYDIQRDDLATVRTQLLVRHLLVDAQPFEEIISVNSNSATRTVEQR